jgi:N-acetylglucosaminyldiphosphoundecaprenol N-acetyl-beta-D-mannosaminyltransferase
MGHQGGGAMSPVRTDALVRDLLGVPISALTMDDVLARIDEAISTRCRLRIGVVNAAKLVNMRRDPALHQDVLSSDLILADGMSVVWASRLLGRPLPERVTGIDLMLGVLRQSARKSHRVYCLGATQKVLDQVAARMVADYPGLELAGRQHGYYGPDEEPAVAAAIAAARADILLVAMTSPRKEHFLARWGDQLGVPVCHGVGGSFDILAGKVRRAPERWQRMGLEWLYRVGQEPRRLWRRYLVTNTLFCGMVLAAWLRESPLRRLKTAISRHPA